MRPWLQANMSTLRKSQKRPKRLIKPGPLMAGYALAQLKPLHRYLPASLLYQLPLGWNREMLHSFVRHGRDRAYIDVPCTLNLPESYVPRAQVDAPYQMSTAEITDFWTQGFSGPHTLLEPNAMQALADEMWALWDAPSTTYPPGTYRFVGPSAQPAGQELSNEEYATRGLNARDKHLQSATMLGLFQHPAIVERVAQLLGPELLMWRTQFFPKYPGHGGTGWHQASAYLNETMRVPTLHPPTLQELFQLTVWVAVTDSTLDNGCLQLLPGSHREIRPMRLEDYDPKVHGENKTDRFGAIVMRPAPPFDDSSAKPFEMKAGQFLIFSERCFHGSRPNITTSDSRLAMNARFIRPEVGIHNPLVLGPRGLDITYLRIAGLQLDRWKIIQARGNNPGISNVDRVIVPTEGMVVNP